MTLFNRLKPSPKSTESTPGNPKGSTPSRMNGLPIIPKPQSPSGLTYKPNCPVQLFGYSLKSGRGIPHSNVPSSYRLSSVDVPSK